MAAVVTVVVTVASAKVAQFIGEKTANFVRPKEIHSGFKVIDIFVGMVTMSASEVMVSTLAAHVSL